MSDYIDFLSSKIKRTERTGIQVKPDELHPSTKPHQRDIILWALELGRAGIFPDCGLGKSHIQIEICRLLHKHIGGKYLIVTELGVTQEFCDPQIGEGARLGVDIQYVLNQQEADEAETFLVITNYERIRLGYFDFSKFNGVCLDEGSYLKNMASDTTDSLQRELAKVKYKYIATATPSPNETLEVINYAHALGVMDRGAALTRFFQRNSQKAGELTIHPQHENDFWLWVYSWSIWITEPADLGYDNEGYDLPPLKVHWHELSMSADKRKITKDRDGQLKIISNSISSLPAASAIKRASVEVRKEKVAGIINSSKEDHFIIWHHLEGERKELNNEFRGMPSYADIFGSQKWETREQRVIDFSKGDLQILATKPELNGVGCNFQKHCHTAIFMGINHQFEAFYQALRRIWRFGQTQPVDVHIIYMNEEQDIANVLKKKWEAHNEARKRMRELMKKYGLDHSKYIQDKKRSFYTNRKEIAGKNFTLVNNDCVQEVRRMEDNSVDMILTSIPFGNHYEYTDKYNDFGHNPSDEDFFRQMDFLIPELLRVLKPGRIAAIHTKDRIHYGSVTGLGFSKLERFTDKTADAFERGGFYCIGYHYIDTDVVRENNQTYRLGWSEMCKDSTKMGSGIPEKILLFRKAPSNHSNAYADEPVTHDKKEYSRARWQIDAHAHWRTNGNRNLTPEEMKSMGHSRVMAWWKEHNKCTEYDYEDHVALCEAMESINRLPSSFMLLPPKSISDNIWDDINFMQCLNAEQRRRRMQNHICPMPFDEVDRCIELYSNKNDLILDPFGGIGTTGVRAIKKNRKAYIIELNETYAKSASIYMKEAERGMNMPDLFSIGCETVPCN